MRKAPGYLQDYELTEMSVYQDIRQPTSNMVEDVGVGGMLGNDIPESRLREAATLETDAGRACADAASGQVKPDTSGSGRSKPTCVRGLLIGLKELCRKNGLNEALTAYLVGRLALDLCDVDPPI